MKAYRLAVDRILVNQLDYSKIEAGGKHLTSNSGSRSYISFFFFFRKF